VKGASKTSLPNDVWFSRSNGTGGMNQSFEVGLIRYQSPTFNTFLS